MLSAFGLSFDGFGVAVDGECEYWGIDLTCVVGTCVDDPSDVEYGCYCDCGSYEPGTWSEDGSPTCSSGILFRYCSCCFTVNHHVIFACSLLPLTTVSSSFCHALRPPVGHAHHVLLCMSYD